jgi:hypothetical protein
MRRQALPVTAYNHIPKKEIPHSLRDADRYVGGRAKQDALAERARERE